MKICMAGACGRMGRRILELSCADPVLEIGGAFDRADFDGTTFTVGSESNRLTTVKITSNAREAIDQSDVLIDFTMPAACVANTEIAASVGKPIVIGTTGLTVEQKEQIKAFSKSIGIVLAPNMSVGVNLLFKLTSQVAAVLGLDYNVEIVELHHNLKKDSPSGTAVRLAECAAESLGLDYAEDTAHGRKGIVGERPVREIGMHAVRGGDIVGEHTVSFIGKGERIELTHKAHNRDNFALGALLAAKFLASAAPGMYDMQDVLGLR